MMNRTLNRIVQAFSFDAEPDLSRRRFIVGAAAVGALALTPALLSTSSLVSPELAPAVHYNGLIGGEDWMEIGRQIGEALYTSGNREGFMGRLIRTRAIDIEMA